MAENVPTIRVKHPSQDRAQFVERYAARVAANGISMPTANLRPVGTRVRLILELKSGDVVVGDAVVEAHVRIRDTPGISLRYVRLDESGIVFPLPPAGRTTAPTAPSPAEATRPPPPARAPERPTKTPTARSYPLPTRRPTPGRPVSAAPPEPVPEVAPAPPTPAPPASTEPTAAAVAAPEAALPSEPASSGDLGWPTDPFADLDTGHAPPAEEPSFPSPPPEPSPPSARAGLTLEDLQLPEPPEPPEPVAGEPSRDAPAPAGAPELAAAPEPEREPAPAARAPQPRQRRTKVLVAAALLLALCAAGSAVLVLQRRAASSAQARAARPATATCERATGTVEVRRRADGAWHPLAAGGPLLHGDVVRTGPASSARLVFATGGALELEERATVEIGVAAPAPKNGAPAPAESSVAVQAGVVRGVLPSAGPSGPVGLVVRGEDGSMTRLATAKGSDPAEVRLTRATKGTEVAVTGGEVEVGAGAASQRVGAGRAIDLPPGAGARPAELLDFPASVAPGVDARFQWKKGLELRLAWKKVPNAVGYRVQVARSLSFEIVSSTLEADGTQVSFQPEEDGMYAWRVASRDAAGRYGEYGFARRFHCDRSPSRDLLVGPADREGVTATGATATVAFSWQSAADAKAYRLLVAPSPKLRARPFVDRVTKEQRLEVKGLAPGTWYWGVYAGEGARAKPIFQKPRTFVVQRAGKTGAR